jgi:hypothetical protein
MVTFLLLMLWFVSVISWFSGRRTSEALRVEVERLTDEVDELRNQLRSLKMAANLMQGEQ